MNTIDTMSNSSALCTRPTIVKIAFEIIPIQNFITEAELKEAQGDFQTREATLRFIFDITEAMLIFGKGARIHAPKNKASIILKAARRLRVLLGKNLHSITFQNVSKKNVFFTTGRFG